MTLTDFCQYTEVRAILGIEPRDLEDTTLALPLYARLLSLALADLSPTLEADYLLTKQKVSKTAGEQKFMDLVQVFSGYAVARELLTALPQFAAMRIVRGKDTYERQIDPEAIKEAVLAAIGRLSAPVLAAYATLSPTNATSSAPRRTLFSNSALGTDPVTGA
ncbi:hypothetical protein [Cupriavidus basilensis]|uniref:hypothetical protein n=1 Tax=Cupriavidus basilensis TaxID=68895 RepID=UPI0020A640BD|nr:hypothetical protein [Cupriavidus basilensis]MCP3024959.1 hypothetical protein [Cupriavidus basilensis]